MYHNQFTLLKDKRFLPLCVAQLLQAFNDNAFKLAMLTLISYHLVTQEAQSAYYQALGTAVFMLPYILFSATFGQMSDKYHKVTLIKAVKAFEILLMVVGASSLWFRNIPMMMLVLFGMGVHSTFFCPLKYAVLPEHLEEDELIGANALLETTLILAILLGTLLGTVGIGYSSHLSLGVVIVSVVMIAFAVLGYVATLYMPNKSSVNTDVRVDLNLIRSTWDVTIDAMRDTKTALAILGISWFWALGRAF